MEIMEIGGVCFGLVVGWVTYRTLHRREGSAAISDLTTVIGAIGGGAVTALWEGDLFGWYALGLAIGFFAYLTAALAIEGRQAMGLDGRMDADKLPDEIP